MGKNNRGSVNLRILSLVFTGFFWGVYPAKAADIGTNGVAAAPKKNASCNQIWLVLNEAISALRALRPTYAQTLALAQRQEFRIKSLMENIEKIAPAPLTKEEYSEDAAGTAAAVDNANKVLVGLSSMLSAALDPNLDQGESLKCFDSLGPRLINAFRSAYDDMQSGYFNKLSATATTIYKNAVRMYIAAKSQEEQSLVIHSQSYYPEVWTRMNTTTVGYTGALETETRVKIDEHGNIVTDPSTGAPMTEAYLQPVAVPRNPTLVRNPYDGITLVPAQEHLPLDHGTARYIAEAQASAELDHRSLIALYANENEAIASKAALNILQMLATSAVQGTDPLVAQP